jgi:exonuclease VII small subunit
MYQDWSGNRVNLLETGDVESDDAGDEYLSGENLKREFDNMSFELAQSGLLLVIYDNQDAANAHFFDLAFEIDELV